MPDDRPDLNQVRTNYQVADDTMINYRPRAFGAIDIPFTDSRQMTQTEGQLLDRLTRDRGLVGLSDFRDIARGAFAEADERFPNNRVPANIPDDRTREWQGNDGHRDAFRHAFWSARLAQEYGADWAKAFTTAHEGVPGNFANREAMDLYNNSIGVQIGAANRNATPEQLADLVQQAVTQGKTVVMDRNGSLEWSDRVGIGQHGLTPTDVIGPKLNTPGVVSTQSVASLDTPRDPNVAVAAANAAPDTTRNVDAMLRDPVYRDVQQAMQTRGLDGDTLAANLYATAKNSQMTTVADIRPGNPITDANGQPDRNLFVFDGKTGPTGQNYAMVSENQARTTPVQEAATVAMESQNRAVAVAAIEPEPKKAMAMG